MGPHLILLIFSLFIPMNTTTKMCQAASPNVFLSEGESEGKKPKRRPARLKKDKSPTKVEGTAEEGEKIRRNDPCPCGSGKRYKHCHGKDE